MRTKTHNFYKEVCCGNFDVIILTETWLNDSVSSRELFDDRYIVYRRDRVVSESGGKKDGGGVLIAILKSIKSIRKLDWESECEDLWVILDLPVSTSVCQLALCGVYLPPPVRSILLDHYVESCFKVLGGSNTYFCLVGDFNLGDINWDLVSDSSCGYIPPGCCHSLLEMVYIHKLNQLNHIRNKSNRILDLVLTNLPISVCSIEESCSVLSVIDPLHPALEISVAKVSENNLSYNLSNKILNFNKASYEDIRKYLSNCDWEELLNTTVNVDEMVEMFYSKLQTVIDKYVPLKKQNYYKYPP